MFVPDKEDELAFDIHIYRLGFLTFHALQCQCRLFVKFGALLGFMCFLHSGLRILKPHS